MTQYNFIGIVEVKSSFKTGKDKSARNLMLDQATIKTCSPILVVTTMKICGCLLSVQGKITQCYTGMIRDTAKAIKYSG